MCSFSKVFHLVNAIVWRFVSPQNSLVVILTLKDDGIRWWAFGRWLGHNDGALMSGISAFIKKTPQRLLVPSPMWRHSEMAMAMNQKEGPHQVMIMLPPWSWTFHTQNLEKQISVVYKLCIVLYLIKADWTVIWNDIEKV